MKTVLILLLAASVLAAQDRPAGAENPLAQLKEEVQRVVAEADLPFSEAQTKAITLMMEDRRKASEDLFGGLMDFSAGPTRGQDADRLNSAIDWMRGEFLGRLQDYLTADQLVAWNRYRETAAAAASTGTAAAAASSEPVRRPQNQTQLVRINNNAFTAEDNSYRNRGGGGNNNFGGNNNNGGAEVIQRGGAGAFHGNAQLLMKHDTLNAGRRFASNKPPYNERRMSFDVGGPVLPGRLSSTIGVNMNRSENVDTIRATLPDSIFALGITRPSTFKEITSRNTLQLSDKHSLSFNYGKRANDNKNQGVGGFIMPDRASDNFGGNWNFEVKQFSALSARNIYETRFNYNTNHNQTIPTTEGIRINVTDAFSNGGAQNKSINQGWNYDFSNLYTRLGEKLTIKAGMEGTYRKTRQIQENNFTGTFSFSSLDAYRTAQPLSFRVTRGIPLLDLGQWETSYFFQNDFKLTPTLTIMSGVRYVFQTNHPDHNNFDPRVGIAYAVGRAAVIRAGAGTFHQYIQNGVIADQIRQDGKHQYEIVIDNPSYPDPFQAGTIRNTFPSIRTTDPNTASPYMAVGMLSYERTFLKTLFISAAYDFSREIHRLRLRNLNAPMDITSTVPASCKPQQAVASCVRPNLDRGNIINLESTGSETAHMFRLNFRERFSIINISGNYQLMMNWTDSLQNVNNFGNSVSQFGFASEGLPSDSYNLNADWARGAQPTHQFNTTVNAQLPMGLFLAGTVNRMSIRRYTVTTGVDDNQDTSANDRPQGVRRNGAPGTDMLNFDFNLSKAFFFGAANGGARTNINVFANMTNAFNRPNYAIPSGVMTSPNFGKSTSAGNPREIEVGLRYQF